MAIESKMARGPIGARPMQEDKKKGWWWVVIAILAVVAVAIGVYFGGWANDGEDEAIASGEYQAVFLDNGQVYFGKLESGRGDFYSLTDVYYLQAGAAGIDQTVSIALTKLGQEAHGPEDRMEINVSHILFIEDMKNDSKVVQAIQQYKSSK
jgi:hypothetical protein